MCVSLRKQNYNHLAAGWIQVNIVLIVIASANVELVALRAAVDNDTSGDIPPHISGLDASRAISIAQQTLRMVADRVKSADNKMQTYDQRGQKQDQEAHDFANALHC